MLTSEFDRVLAISSIMTAQSDEISLDILATVSGLGVVATPPLGFRDLSNQVGIIRGTPTKDSELAKAAKSLANAELCLLDQRPFGIKIMNRGEDSLTAYRAYEQVLTQSYIEYYASPMKTRLGNESAQKLIRNFLSASVDTTSELIRGFSSFPAIRRILQAQSLGYGFVALFALSTEAQLPPSLTHQIDFGQYILRGDNEVVEKLRSGILQRLSKVDLVQTDDEEPRITSLGEASLRAFNDYYSVLEYDLVYDN
ncbi:MAG: hypothetical protein Q7R49_03570 [Candidatus Daviesbacteria bacterium]|nr:hypothetical protein [Candidatus Daviesbacteria bacterium]